MAKRKILIAIANNFTLDIFSKNFSQENFAVIAVDNGEKALKTAEKDMPDIMIIDVALTGINGFELIELLRKNEDTRKIPILVYSRSGSSDHKERAIDLEVTDFINGLIDSPKETVSRTKIHLGAQKSYLIKASEKSNEKVKELAEDIKENFKCPFCGNENVLYLIRNLKAGEKDFKISFVCPDCSFQNSSNDSN